MAKFIRQMNWELLKKQKETLISLSMNNVRITPRERDDLDGIVHLLDALQDWAVDEQGVAKELVFPGLYTEDTPEPHDKEKYDREIIDSVFPPEEDEL